MPFEKGHKLAKGGARPGAGRKTLNEQQIRLDFIKSYWQQVYKTKETILTKFFNDDLSPREIVKQVIPYAKGEDEQIVNRPIAIQVVVEGHTAEPRITVESAGNGRSILIGGE